MELACHLYVNLEVNATCSFHKNLFVCYKKRGDPLVGLILNFAVSHQSVKQKFKNLMVFFLASANIFSRVGHFQAFDGEKQDLGEPFDVRNDEDAFIDPVFQNLGEHHGFPLVEFVADFFYFEDVQEENTVQVSVSDHDALIHLKMSANVLLQLLAGFEILLHHRQQGSGHNAQFTVNARFVNFLLAPEVGVERTASFSGSSRNIVHSCLHDAFLSEKLSGYLYQHTPGFRHLDEFYAQID